MLLCLVMQHELEKIQLAGLPARRVGGSFKFKRKAMLKLCHLEQSKKFF